MKINEYTVSRRTIRESAEGIYQAALCNMKEMKQTIACIEEQIG